MKVLVWLLEHFWLPLIVAIVGGVTVHVMTTANLQPPSKQGQASAHASAALPEVGVEPAPQPQAEEECRVSFYGLRAFWDTSWGDDEFALVFSFDSSHPVTAYGVECKDNSGMEIEYLDSPQSGGGIQLEGEAQQMFFCIHSNYEGEHTGSLVAGETYYWSAYAICHGRRYESPVESFVFSTDGSRWP